MKPSIMALKVSLCLMVLALTGCGGDLWVTTKDFTTVNGSGPIAVSVTFNKAVDPTTVILGTSLILAGGKDNNATGNLVWANPTQLSLTTTKPWAQIAGGGGTDSGFTLTLKNSIRAQDGSVIDECKTGKPGTDKPGDCVLSFVIPG